ncbi:MAG: hypothetical protein R3F14_00050 [Polyangiaceae bacterium]
MARLDESYRPDGLCAARIGDVTRLRSGGPELDALEPIMPLGSRLEPLPEVAFLEISAAATILQKQFGYVTLYAEAGSLDVCFIGEVLELDDDFIHLKQLGPLKAKGRSDVVIRLDEITRVDVEEPTSDNCSKRIAE